MMNKNIQKLDLKFLIQSLSITMNFMDGLMIPNNGMMDFFLLFLKDFVLILNQIRNGWLLMDQ